ncbi:unnamed protein product [Effrenium voratum]|uniref:Uncharacterized protein n=1 Tax=Effrenium voratum TaxID=2562239 RepID=A0AA36HLB0_9DINO|nr:unnamed protein product [Effrenium voratum]
MAVSRVARLALGAALLALGGLTLTAPSAERPPRAPRGGRAERVLAEEAELPTPKTWRELRRHPRFDHSPGSGWRTQLLPDKEASDPRRVQEGLTRAERLSGVLRVLDGADLSSWSAINVATAWHRLAKFSRLPKRGAAPDQRDLQIRDLQRRLAERARELGPEEFTPRSISTLFYAWGLKRFKCKLLKPFSISARTRLKEFDPQSIANMVFGMGLLGLQYEDRLLEEVGKQVPQRLIEFQLEEVISMFYSLGKLRYSPAEGKLLAAMGDYATSSEICFG